MWRKGVSVSMVNGLSARLPGNRGSIPEVAKIFHHLLLTTFTEHQASCSMDTDVSFPGVKRLAFEADNRNPRGAKVKKSLSCTFLYSHTTRLLHVFLN